MTLLLDGTWSTHGRDHKGARWNLEKWQRQHLLREFPEIQHCFSGTINLTLDAALYVVRTDTTTTSIQWKPGVTERFSFLRVRFACPRDSDAVDAWIYLAHDSPHRNDPCSHEIMTTYHKLPTPECRVWIDRPYRECEISYKPFRLILID